MNFKTLLHFAWRVALALIVINLIISFFDVFVGTSLNLSLQRLVYNPFSFLSRQNA